MAIYFSSKNYSDRHIGWRYEDFKQGKVYIKDSIDPIDVALIPVESNSKAAWQMATSPNMNCDCRIYEVSLKEEVDIDNSIENLQYFFIRADRARKDNSDDYKQLGLMIHADGKDVFRIQTYLAMISGSNSRYNLLYCTTLADGSKWCYPIEAPHEGMSGSLNSVGRFMPLLRVVEHGVEMASGDIDIADLICTEQYTNDYLVGTKISNEDIEEYCERPHNTRELPWWESLQDCCKVFLIRLSQNVVGTRENPLQERDKQKIRKDLSQFIIAQRMHMSLLGELCWFFNLQYLMEDKYLLSETEKALDMATLQQSYLDAVTYTEGILQLLENSCQHSQQHLAYLSMRVHYVDRTGTDPQLIKAMRKRDKLMKRYKELAQKDWKLEKNATNYIEISVIDSASAGGKRRRGILETYRQNAMKYGAKEEDLPKKLINIYSDSNQLMAPTDESIIHHYGIPALKQVVIKNHGCFLVSSPNIDTTEVVSITQDATTSVERNELDETSEYHILFPLGLVEPRISHEKADNWTSLFELDYLKHPMQSNIETKLYKISADLKPLDFDELFLNQDEKIKRVSEAHRAFLKRQEEISEKDNCVYLFDIRKINGLQLELFAKFLFGAILSGNGERRLYAVYFDDYLKEQELIRLFAIFYERAAAAKCNQGEALLGAQIALCSTNPELEVPEVNLILNIKNWDSLLESARRFAYCNLESAQYVYSQIKYLSRNRLNKSTDIAQFPFDLFLSEQMMEPQIGNSQVKIAGSNDCWFLQRISKLMERDLQKNKMGIKITDIHAYLLSNVHIESFYQAEQLFHNVSYVCRFAYLMALRLVRSGYSGINVLIVSYEAYSSLLVQYLASYMEAALGPTSHVEYATMYQEKKGHRQLVMPPALQSSEVREKFFSDCSFIALCPIGTTLSTIHIMHDCIEKETGISLNGDNVRDMVMILVAEDAQPAKIQSRYWRFNTVERYTTAGQYSIQQQESVQLYSRYSESQWKVSFFLIAKTKWHDPEDCADLENERALVHADSTSTELNMIFPQKTIAEEVFSGKDSEVNRWRAIHRHDVCSLMKFEDIAVNDKRIELLKGCISYGHISRGSNHYAYYLDLPRYYQKIRPNNTFSEKSRGPESYYSWLSSLRMLQVNKDAFNIIVSPLRNGSSPLLKDLVDRVFDHSTHILQLDLHNVRRTDVRTKYSYIASEYLDALKSDPNVQINIYYVDDSVVTADTLHRGRSLVQLLIKDCFPKTQKPFLYTGVFVLVNRSSRDTVQNFVNDPDRDFHAFVHLAVPHYNTRNNHCPACKRVEKYELLTARSTTNCFAKEYQRLVEKHQLRSIEEYERWQKEQLFVSPSAYLRLRQWIFSHSDCENQSAELDIVRTELDCLKDQFCKRFLEAFKPNTDKYDDLVDALTQDRELQQHFLEALERETLEGQLGSAKMENRKIKSAFEHVWINCVLGETAHKRLMSTHKAYCQICLEMEPTALNDTNELNSRKSMCAAILKYLTPNPECVSPQARWECIHSGLKVVSRDYLARHHLVREAIFYILHSSADAMLGKTLADEHIYKLFRVESSTMRIPALDNQEHSEIDPLLRYQMFYTILRRLSDMQSNYAILGLSEGTVLKKLDALTRTFFVGMGTKEEIIRRWFYCSIPSRKQMDFDYEKCIKLSTMSEDEENKSLLIQTAYIHRPNNSKR